MKFIKKIEPFFENIIIGLLFVGMGLHIIDGFDDSSFGIIGFYSIVWGGFKITIGVIIYGITILSIRVF